MERIAKSHIEDGLGINKTPIVNADKQKRGGSLIDLKMHEADHKSSLLDKRHRKRFQPSGLAYAGRGMTTSTKARNNPAATALSRVSSLLSHARAEGE
jgi:hypothetical protein